jgi:hypothetical protein
MFNDNKQSPPAILTFLLLRLVPKLFKRMAMNSTTGTHLPEEGVVRVLGLDHLPVQKHNGHRMYRYNNVKQ